MQRRQQRMLTRTLKLVCSSNIDPEHILPSLFIPHRAGHFIKQLQHRQPSVLKLILQETSDCSGQAAEKELTPACE